MTVSVFHYFGICLGLTFIKMAVAQEKSDNNNDRASVTFTGEAALKFVDIISKNCNGKAQPVCIVNRPTDCGDLDKVCLSGIYKIYPENTSGFDVFCDMDHDGGGWTVFQRRMNGEVDFYRNWETYKHGFGKLDTEFWLGNEHLHQITSQGNYMLRIDLEDFDNNIRYAEYNQFSVDDESTKYTLSVGGYSGNAGDSFSYANGSKFSTFDNDNDVYGSNCAENYKGAWWYTACHKSNLNGLYLKGIHESFANGVEWKSWKGQHYSLKNTTMKMRRISSLT